MQNERSSFQKSMVKPYFSSRRTNNLNDDNCGLAPNTKYDRIVGGKETDPNEYPWNVALTLPWGQQFCGGALINKLVSVVVSKWNVIVCDINLVAT